ncbi:MAG: TRAP transporter small permease [Candidatus Accumulibacter sp.]|jgi:TRAP-type C4-dicarboxylate transport system permease small subunit|nr:TRAP transporter small permease [Accumulibacter sp.]
MLANVLRKLYDGCGVGAAASIFFMALFVVAGVVLRVVHVTIPGAIEIPSFCLVSTSFLALAHTFRHNVHIRISLVTDRLSPRPRRFLEMFALLVAGITSFWLAYYTGEMAWEAFIYNDRSEGMLSIPLCIPQFLMSLGILMLGVSVVEEFVRMCRGHKPTYEVLGRAARDADDFGADR